MFDWLPINRLAEARVARCEVGNRCNGKLICYRDCLISLSLSSRFHSCSSLSFRHRPLCLSIMLPSRELHGGGVWAFKPASKQKSTCASTRGELAWIGERFWQLSVSCILFFFFFLIFQLSVSWSSSPLFRNAVPPTPPYICVCQCGSWSGILNAVYSCCGWVAKARYGRQLVIRLIMLPFFFLWSRP